VLLCFVLCCCCFVCCVSLLLCFGLLLSSTLAYVVEHRSGSSSPTTTSHRRSCACCRSCLCLGPSRRHSLFIVVVVQRVTPDLPFCSSSSSSYDVRVGSCTTTLSDMLDAGLWLLLLLVLLRLLRSLFYSC